MSELRTPYLSLVCIGLLVGLAALAGALGSPGTWYAEASRPGWAPSGGRLVLLTGIGLVLSGLAAWRVWVNRVLPGAVPGLMAWGMQLVLVTLWGVLMFDLHRPGWATPVIGGAGLAVAATVVFFGRVSTPARWLSLAWLAWVGVLALITLQIWRMN